MAMEIEGVVAGNDEIAMVDETFGIEDDKLRSNEAPDATATLPAPTNGAEIGVIAGVATEPKEIPRELAREEGRIAGAG